MDKNYLVSKSNKLICARGDLSLQEQKIVLVLASIVQKDDEEFKEYTFKIAEFLELLGSVSQEKYTDVPKLIKGLMKKVVEIKEDKQVMYVHWIESATHYTSKGIIKVKISSEMKPYLLQLNELFTTYKLENILDLNSKYSIRLYEILKSEKFKKNTDFIDIEELRAMLGANSKSYDLFKCFRKKVLEVAQKELKEKTDIKFEIGDEPQKTGRKITGIKFKIHNNTPTIKKTIDKIINQNSVDVVTDEISATKENNQSENDILIQQIQDIIPKIKKPDCNKILEAYNNNIERITKAYNYTRKQSETRTIKSVVAYMISIKNSNLENISLDNSNFNNFKQRKCNFECVDINNCTKGEEISCKDCELYQDCSKCELDSNCVMKEV